MIFIKIFFNRKDIRDGICSYNISYNILYSPSYKKLVLNENTESTNETVFSLTKKLLIEFTLNRLKSNVSLFLFYVIINIKCISFETSVIITVFIKKVNDTEQSRIFISFVLIILYH